MKKSLAFTLTVFFIVCSLSSAFAAEKIDPPVLIKRVALFYPEDALKQKIEGKVELKIFVSDKGMIEQVDVIQGTGNTSLDQAAINTVKQWEFLPALKDGKECSAILIIPFVFKLHNDNMQATPEESANPDKNS